MARGAAEAYTAELAREQKIANDQRVILFRSLLISAGVCVLLAVAFVVLVGLKVPTLATPIALELISALFVYSSVPVGFIARGLYLRGKVADAVPTEVE